jgi:MFS family permease
VLAATQPLHRLIAIASAVFALRFVALAAFNPYTFLWLESNGFDTHERGLLGGFASAVRFGAPMVLGTLADWTGRRRLVFVSATIINSLAVAALTLQPESAISQGLLLGLCGLTETGSLLDAFVMRSLSWAGAANSAPRARAWGAFTWCVAAPLFGTIAQRLGIATLFRAYGCFQLLALPVCLLLPIAQAYGEETPGARTAAATASPLEPAQGKARVSNAGTNGCCAEAGIPSDGANGGASLLQDLPGGARLQDFQACNGQGTPVPFEAVAPARSQGFVRRFRRAVFGAGPSSRELRFAIPLLSLVGLQMGIGFTFGFIYLKEELHAAGFLIGLSLTAQAAIEVPLFRSAGELPP